MFSESVDVQVQATSADGTEVPFTCLRGGSDSDGHLPTLVYAYGGAILFYVSFSSQIFARLVFCLSCIHAFSLYCLRHADSLLMHLKLHQFLLRFGLLEDECQSRITRDHQNQRGFGIPLLPNYNATIGAAWLERGGQYVEAR